MVQTRWAEWTHRVAHHQTETMTVMVVQTEAGEVHPVEVLLGEEVIEGEGFHREAGVNQGVVVEGEVAIGQGVEEGSAQLTFLGKFAIVDMCMYHCFPQIHYFQVIIDQSI